MSREVGRLGQVEASRKLRCSLRSIEEPPVGECGFDLRETGGARGEDAQLVGLDPCAHLLGRGFELPHERTQAKMKGAVPQAHPRGQRLARAGGRVGAAMRGDGLGEGVRGLGEEHRGREHPGAVGTQHEPRPARYVDWAGLSADSASEQVQVQLGRGQGGHVRRAIEHADRCHLEGVRVKLNTVVTSLTWREDMSGLVRRIRPARWKVLQVLRVVGQNDGQVEPLLISDEQFGAFVERHAPLEAEGFSLVAESNAKITDSYVMVDPLGRFFGDSGGRHHVSRPILEVGVEVALAVMGYSESRFEGRGGRFTWRTPLVRAQGCASAPGGPAVPVGDA